MRVRADDLPRLATYAAAEQYIHETTPIRGWGTIPLGPRTKHKHMNIRKDSAGDIHVRLYDLDIITYHPDDTLTLRAYSSQSTEAVANAVLPLGIICIYASQHGLYVRLDHSEESVRYYCMNGSRCRLRRIGRSHQQHVLLDEKHAVHFYEIIDGLGPVKRLTLDRSKTGAILKKTSYAGFAAWLRAAVALKGEQDRGYRKLWWNNSDRDFALEMLEKGNFALVLETIGLGYSLRALDRLRTFIYEASSIRPLVREVEVNIITHYQLIACSRSYRKLANLARSW